MLLRLFTIGVRFLTDGERLLTDGERLLTTDDGERLLTTDGERLFLRGKDFILKRSRLDLKIGDKYLFIGIGAGS